MTSPVTSPSSPAMTPVTSPQQRQVLISALMLLEKNFPDMDEDERLLRAGRHARARAHVTTSSAARARVEQARPELDPIVKELMVTHLTNFADGPEGLDLILKALEDDEIDMPALRLINPAELMEFGIAEGPTIAILQAVEKDRLLKAVEKDQLEKKKRRRARRTPSSSLFPFRSSPRIQSRPRPRPRPRPRRCRRRRDGTHRWHGSGRRRQRPHHCRRLPRHSHSQNPRLPLLRPRRSRSRSRSRVDAAREEFPRHGRGREAPPRRTSCPRPRPRHDELCGKSPRGASPPRA